ncbi:MAG: polysaccharide deacetylase family protein [Chitinivibrionia bacterium]|nr:polysaccharide deacetylase family protein [Chitinivibrionia bacterium]
MVSKTKFFAMSLMATLFMFTATTFAQNVAASTSAPGGIEREQVPQFIVIGSDDNTNADAMRWMVGVMEGRRHDGTTFSATNHDGSKRRMSFYVNTAAGTNGGANPTSSTAWANNEDLKNSVVEAYRAGHSIGNHTHSHPHFVTSAAGPNAGSYMSAEDVRQEILDARSAMAAAGIPLAHQFGFRTPFLAYSDISMGVVRELGFLYDCSIEATVGMAGGTTGGANFPYTLHAASPDNAGSWWVNNPANAGLHTRVGDHPGLWQLLATQVEIAPQDRAAVVRPNWMIGGEACNPPVGDNPPVCWMNPDLWTMSGLDYNLWAPLSASGLAMNEDQTYNALMHTLQQHLDGNRAPFTFGAHSQYYFQPDNAYPNINANARRRAFERFIESASQLENVFFVSGDMVIRWMKNPVPLSSFNVNDLFEGYTGGGFTAVNRIDGVPTTANVGVLNLTGQVVPASATNRNIIWSVYNQGTTGATIDGNTLNTTGAGIVVVRATITNGASETSNYTQNFNITVSETVVGEFFELIDWEHTNWGAFTEYTEEGIVLDDNSATSITSQPQEPLIGSMTLGTRDGGALPDRVDPWPYLGIAAYYDEDFFDNLQYVEITYTSDNFFFVAIGSTLRVGTTPVDYAFRLPAAPSGNTVAIPLSAFQAPRWMRADGGWGGTLAQGTLDQIERSQIAPGITFTITADPETGATFEGHTVNFTVSSVKMWDGTPASINPHTRNNSAVRRAGNSIQINNFRAGNLNLNVGQSGLYTVSIHDVSGRVLAQTRTNLVAGTNSLSIGQNLARGIAIVRIEGANATLVRRISVR